MKMISVRETWLEKSSFPNISIWYRNQEILQLSARFGYWLLHRLCWYQIRMISFILSTLSHLLLTLLLGKFLSVWYLEPFGALDYHGNCSLVPLLGPNSKLVNLFQWCLCEYFHFSISYQRRTRIQSSIVHSSKGFYTSLYTDRLGWSHPVSESLIQVITFLTTSMSILLPIILQPNWAYFYAAMAVVAGYLFYIPFFHYNISFPGTGWDFSLEILEIYLVDYLSHKIEFYPRKVLTDFILFCNYILKVCPKFTRMNKQIKISLVNVSQFQLTVYYVTSSRTVTLAFAGSEYIMMIWIPFAIHFISKFSASISKNHFYLSLLSVANESWTADPNLTQNWKRVIINYQVLGPQC